jgi:hypothetical protein
MRLGTEVVNFVRLHLADDAGEVGGVGQIPVVQAESRIFNLGIFVDVIDPLCVKEGGAAFDAVDFVAFFEKKFGEIGTVLAGDTGD